MVVLASAAPKSRRVQTARLKFPDVLGFLVVGFVVGEAGLHLIHISLASQASGIIIALAASVILYECGHDLDREHLGSAWRGLALLVTAGVLITAGLVAFASHLAFGWDWATATLFGTIIAATDPAAVIPVMRQSGISKRISNLAQAESALNDIVGAILTIVALAIVQGGRMSGPDTMTTVAVTVLYLAAFVAGLAHRGEVQPVFSALTFLARLIVFVMLGASLSPASAAFPILATGAFIVAFMFVIRPIAVFATLWADRTHRWNVRELLMLSWVRETGVMSAALAANVSALAITSAEPIVAKTTAVIVATVIIQGFTTGPIARLLGVANAPPASET
jgi:potassium/hydrogen antiporter